MKIWRLTVVVLAAFSLASCSNDEEGGSQEYQPAHRSAIFNEVKLMLTDADGNDLGGSNEVFSSMKVYGELSRQYASIESMTEDGLTYLKFNADLPDERNIKYNDDKSIGTGTSTMTVTVDGKTDRLTFDFETTTNGEAMYGGNAIHVTGVQDGSKHIRSEEKGNLVVVLMMDEGGLSLTDEIPVPEEASLTNLTADTPLGDKVFLGSGYDATGAYLSNACLRDNVIDLSKCDGNQLMNFDYDTGTGSMPGDADNAKEFLKGLCESLEFKNEGEPGDVCFAGTFTDNPLFKDASERGNGYSFLMYMDYYTFYCHRLNLGLSPSDALLERVLTDDFKKALAEESAERIVERFGTHVLMNARLGLNILSLYRSGLKANTRDEARFTASMFRRMGEVYKPIFWNKTSPKATKGGAISVQFHGGSTQQLSAALGQSPLTAEESSAAVANWWNESCESRTNLSLTLLEGDDLWPIYELIPDGEKRAEVERAVKAYIHSHQL